MKAMNSALSAVSAAIYARISNDREGLERGVERQQEDCRALAAALGCTVVGVFVDNDVSASTASRKPRPAYTAMMARAAAGEFSLILAYSNSRLTRRPLEVEDLIRLREAHGVQVRTVVSGDDDLGTADGRMVARIKGTIDAAEAERISERTRRAMAQLAAQGKWRGGHRPFGFRVGGVDHDSREAEAIRRATRQILEGYSLNSIAREWNRARIRTSTGGPWLGRSVRTVLLRPRNAGLIHVGVMGRDDFRIVGRASWAPVVDEDLWRGVVQVLRDPGRRSIARREAVWLGSGIYRCGALIKRDGAHFECGARLRVKTRMRPAGNLWIDYSCTGQDHLSINQDAADRAVLDAVELHLSSPRILEAMRQLDAPTADLRVERARLAERERQVHADYIAGLISAQLLRAAVEPVLVALARVDARLDALRDVGASSRILHARTPANAFRAAGINDKRALIRATVDVTIASAGRPKTRTTGERVRVTLRITAPTDA